MIYCFFFFVCVLLLLFWWRISAFFGGSPCLFLCVCVFRCLFVFSPCVCFSILLAFLYKWPLKGFFSFAFSKDDFGWVHCLTYFWYVPFWFFLCFLDLFGMIPLTNSSCNMVGMCLLLPILSYYCYAFAVDLPFLLWQRRFFAQGKLWHHPTQRPSLRGSSGQRRGFAVGSRRVRAGPGARGVSAAKPSWATQKGKSLGWGGHVKIGMKKAKSFALLKLIDFF